MGDFTFIAPGMPAPLDRRGMRPQRPLRGADPPEWLAGIVREAKNHGPATLLWNGDFCGHGEPAYSVFDVVIDGRDLLELSVTDESGEMSILVRPAAASGSWHVIHLSTWFQGEAKPGGPMTMPPGKAKPMSGRAGKTAMRVAVGCEYPIECTSRNDISWFAVYAQEDDEPSPFCVFDQELC